MMPELLARHTSMTVVQASDGMLVEPRHLYTIPPGRYLSVIDGTLRLSAPEARHGARLPFDVLLRSLANGYREHAICIILSGTGADGSVGLKAVKEKGGLVIAQNPEEAAYDGMPRSAVLTGAVDLVLPLADMPDALVKFQHRMTLSHAGEDPASPQRHPARPSSHSESFHLSELSQFLNIRPSTPPSGGVSFRVAFRSVSHVARQNSLRL